ncbi:hypothetical protein GO730_19570 [Spirosoma sp. HMF3257]|uniref:Dystroglycan-type cadherin-like domain-containing protein n=1 Tax=Spirosoma telluris TaxID=2183553 RepID=A0A327NKA6_9BACT|nr:hypothetical protein [Spirosoma telluris]RAI75801.1 hypothetical protein HMF3257_19505 [Spirosoma telluris]
MSTFTSTRTLGWLIGLLLLGCWNLQAEVKATFIKTDSIQSTKSFSEPNTAIAPIPISLTATAGVPFEYQIPALSPHTNAVYSSPQLPANGLSLLYDTYPPSIFGTPDATGVMNLTINATANVNNQIESAWVAITITVNPPTPISLTATAGVPFNYEIPVLIHENNAGYSSPELPGNGLRLSYDTYPPSIVGAPNATGVINLTVNTHNTSNGVYRSAWVPIIITVNAPTPISLTATAGVPFNYEIPVLLHDNSTGYTSPQLPTNGLSLSYSTYPPSIVGTPTVTGVMNLTVNAHNTVNSQDESAWVPIIITVNPSATSFALTGVNLISCQTISDTQRQLTFTPQYVGTTEQPIFFTVYQQLPLTTQPGPYSLNLDTSNPLITLIAQQDGVLSSYNYQWLAGCNTTTPNRPPTTTGIPPQATQTGQAYQLSLANYFADPDGNPLTYIVSGLPSTLNLTGVIISGTPASTGSFPISVTAVDPSGLFVSTSFQLTVNGATQPFTLASVSTNGCQNLGGNQWQVTFTPHYTGLTGEQIVLAMTNGVITTQAGPYSQTLSTDQPLLTLIAQQGNTTSAYNYFWLVACTGSARQAAREVGNGLQVNVFGNPVQSQQVELEIKGVMGSWVEVTVMDMQGRCHHQQRLDWPTDSGRVNLPLAPGIGTQLVQVRTEGQVRTVKLLKSR